MNQKRVYRNILLDMDAAVIQLFNNTGLFCRLEFQFRKKLNIKCREFQLILQMIAMEINLIITMTKLQSETRIMNYRNLSKQIF